MRGPARTTQFTRRVSATHDWVPPVDGWRTDENIANMGASSAFVLDNWFPESNRVRIRLGSVAYATGLGGDVQTLIAYSGATNKLFATANGHIWDITGGGTPTSLISGLTSDRWSAQQFTNAGGHWIRMVNGADTPRLYDGTSWTTTAITGITDAKKLLAVTAYRSRLWFIEKDTTNVWYLATSAVSGAASQLDVGGNMKFGGTVAAISTWPMSTQTGLDQSLVVVTTEGEILIYHGSDPSDPSTWMFFGGFKIGSPLGGDRCMLNVGGDIAIMTVDGIIPISKAVQVDRGAIYSGAMTAKIAPSWLETVAATGTAASQWQLVSFPKRKMAIVNLPNALGPYQYVMNTETGAWCRFTGLTASCWATWQDGLYFGSSDGTVYEAETGGNDNGASIDALMVGAWTELGDSLSQKYVKMVGASTLSDFYSQVFIGVSTNYVTSVPQSVTSGAGSVTASYWDSALWDTSYFAGATFGRQFASPGSVGVAFAPTIRALVYADSATAPEAAIIGGSMVYEMGQPI